MFTIIIAVVFLAILIIGHEFGHFITAKFFGLKVSEFGFGFPPRIFKKKVGETVYSFNALPFGGFVRIHGESFVDEKTEREECDDKKSFRNLVPYKKAIIITAGAIMNFLIGWLVIAIVFMIGTSSSVFIGQIASGSPADVVGLVAGDELQGFNSVDELVSFINTKKGEEISLSVLRAGEELTVNVIPRVNPPAGEGPLGVSLIEGGIAKHGFFGAIYEGFKASIKIIGFIFLSIFHLIAALFTANWEATAGVAGPVGIFNFLDTAGKLGVVYLLQILGLISLNLTVINIIPFPALDGGRLMFVIYEKISGGRLNYKLETIAHAVGFAILIFLMVMVTIKDIMNLV